MPKLSDINKIRSVEWSRRYLWDIYFEEIVEGSESSAITSLAKKSFNSFIDQFTGVSGAIPKSGTEFEWYPIIKFSDEEAAATNKILPGTYQDYIIPSGGKLLNMSITFIDDVNNSMFEWAKKWVNPYVAISESVEVSLTTAATATTEAVTEPWTINSSTRCVKTISDAMKVIVVSKLDNQMNEITTNTYAVIPEGTLTFTGDSDDGLHTYELKMVKVRDYGSKRGTPQPRLDLISKKASGVLRRFTK